MAVTRPGVAAMPRPRKKKLTPEQLYESLNEDVKAELIEGEVITMSPVSIKHNRLQIPDVRATLQTLGLR